MSNKNQSVHMTQTFSDGFKFGLGFTVAAFIASFVFIPGIVAAIAIISMLFGDVLQALIG